MVEHVIDTHDDLDLLVANAVVWPRENLGAAPPWRDSLRANVEGTIAMSKQRSRTCSPAKGDWF